MRDLVSELREDLLRAGLSPRHVGRYLRELSEHRADIEAHLRQAGLPAKAARQQADRRLGDRDALLLPMLADRRFRSYAARWPALFYLVLPLGLQLGFAVFGVCALLLATGTGLRAAMADLGAVTALLLLVSPVLLSWLALGAARHRYAPLRWPLLGAVAGAAFAAALQLVVTSPADGVAGQIGLGVGMPAPLLMVALLVLSLLPLSLQSYLE